MTRGDVLDTIFEPRWTHSECARGMILDGGNVMSKPE
jgi:hypothetical protein